MYVTIYSVGFSTKHVWTPILTLCGYVSASMHTNDVYVLYTFSRGYVSLCVH